MSPIDITRFIDGDRLTAIGYTTAERPETVHPQVLQTEGGWCVYGRAGDATKRRIPLNEFARHLTGQTKGLAVRGIRPSDGRATSISFSQSARLTVSEAFMEWARTQAA